MGLFFHVPDFSDGFARTPLLDGFRDRAARATLADGREGVIYVQSMPYAEQVSGHLWWARWSEPREAALIHYDLPDGEIGDHWLFDDEGLRAEAADWRLKRYRGMRVEGRESRVYALTWLDEAESESIRRDFVGDGE